MPQADAKLTLSVVIPTWLRHQQVIQLLNSLKWQTRPPDEVLVVCRPDDHQSIDAVREWALSSKTQFQHQVVRVYEEGHLPPLIAALKECRSDIFCLIDDDAIPRSDWLLQLEKDFDDPLIGGIGGTIINHCGEAANSGRPAVETPGRLSWFGRSGGCRPRADSGELQDADCPVGCNMAFRRSALEGAFDMVLNDGSAISYETDVALNIKRKGLRFCYDPCSVVDHYLTPRNIDAKRGWNARECYVYAHNLTYICFKHLTWYGRLGFLIYFFIGGSWGCPGPATFILSFLRGCPLSWREQFVPAMKGRLSGIRSYYRSKLP